MTAPVFDNVTSIPFGVQSAPTATFTCTGANGLLLAWIGGDTNSAGGNTVNTMTFAGVNMKPNVLWDSGANFQGSACYWLANPSTTPASTWAATINGQYDNGAVILISFSNVNQSTPLGTQNTNAGTTSPTSVVISGSAGQVFVDFIAMNNGGFFDLVLGSAGANLTTRKLINTNGSAGCATCDGASSVTRDWTDVNVGQWRAGGVPINGISSGTLQSLALLGVGS